MKRSSALIFVALISNAAAQEAAKIDPVDFVVDGRDMLQKRITLAGCHLVGANQYWVSCRSPSNPTITIPIDAKTLEMEDFRRALKECAAYDATERCQGEVSGVVASGISGTVGLRNGRIAWTVK